MLYTFIYYINAAASKMFEIVSAMTYREGDGHGIPGMSIYICELQSTIRSGLYDPDDFMLGRWLE